MWGFLCEHRANPTALNAVRSAPVRRAHVCGVVTGACFPRPAPVSGAGSARYDGGFASCRSAHSTPGSQARGSPAYLCGFRPKLNRPFVIAVRTSAHDVGMRARQCYARRPMVRPHPDELARIGATRRIGASGVGVYMAVPVFGTDTPPPLPVHDAPRCRLNRLCSEPPILHGRAGHSLLSLNTHHPPN